VTKPIGTYVRREATVHPWDPKSIDVARKIAALVETRRPDLRVEHIGSTAIPDMPGKGIIDLTVEVEPQDIAGVVEVLYDLGFQPQPGPDPWPPTRPMPVGEIEFEGKPYRIHFHVQPMGGYQRRDLAFRDALRDDPELARQYAELKVGITGGGAVDGYRYTQSKTAWILNVYRRLGFLPAAIPPPATIAIVGGGQLARMLALAARELGYGIAVLDPDPGCPAAAVADRVEVGGYDDVAAAKRLADGAAVVTFDLEHVDPAVLAALDDGTRPLRPGAYALKVAQDRLLEKTFLEANRAPVAPWREIRSAADLRSAAATLGLPIRLKSARGGYDGRSQERLADAAAVEDMAARIDSGGGIPLPAVAERELAFASELSVIVARGLDGATRAFPPARNVHDDGILVECLAPAPIDAAVLARAETLAAELVTAVGVVGLLTVEMFLMPDGALVVNELAPRVHNSGHWTIEGAATSQFEQHIRAICGLPLGDASARAAAIATVNILGRGSKRPARLQGVPDALAVSDLHLHLYDKSHVFERRKMGHVTAIDSDPEAALARAREAHAKLSWAGE
jgi:5-(carboxyamino)imidazole ribonucleotide synthase